MSPAVDHVVKVQQVIFYKEGLHNCCSKCKMREGTRLKKVLVCLYLSPFTLGHELLIHTHKWQVCDACKLAARVNNAILLVTESSMCAPEPAMSGI